MLNCPEKLGSRKSSVILTEQSSTRAASTPAVEALVSSCDALHIFCHAGFGGLAFLAREAGQHRT